MPKKHLNLLGKELPMIESLIFAGAFVVFWVVWCVFLDDYDRAKRSGAVKGHKDDEEVVVWPGDRGYDYSARYGTDRKD